MEARELRSVEIILGFLDNETDTEETLRNKNMLKFTRSLGQCAKIPCKYVKRGGISGFETFFGGSENTMFRRKDGSGLQIRLGDPGEVDLDLADLLISGDVSVRICVNWKFYPLQIVLYVE
jgi:hypothetical protein